MKRYHVYAEVVSSMYCGVIEAENDAEARAKVESAKEIFEVKLCEGCAKVITKPEVLDYFLQAE